jgi:hypothetical protein
MPMIHDDLSNKLIHLTRGDCTEEKQKALEKAFANFVNIIDEKS